VLSNVPLIVDQRHNNVRTYAVIIFQYYAVVTTVKIRLVKIIKNLDITTNVDENRNTFPINSMKSVICIALCALTYAEGAKLSLVGRRRQQMPRRPHSLYHKNKYSSSSACSMQGLLCKYKDLNHTMSIRGGGIGSLDLLFRNYPYAAAFLVCATKATFADAIAQKSNNFAVRQKVMDMHRLSCTKQRRNSKSIAAPIIPPFKLQYKQTMAFLFYGGLYQGCFQEFLYNNIYPRLFGSDANLSTAIKKVCCEMFVVAPTLCIPFAYIVKAFVYRHSIQKGMSDYRHDVMKNGLLFKNWSIWGPVNIMTFTIIPTHYRIAFVAFFSFFWMMLLSSISSKSKDIEE
jgi:hypothetical protein